MQLAEVSTPSPNATVAALPKPPVTALTNIPAASAAAANPAGATNAGFKRARTSTRRALAIDRDTHPRTDAPDHLSSWVSSPTFHFAPAVPAATGPPSPAADMRRSPTAAVNPSAAAGWTGAAPAAARAYAPATVAAETPGVPFASSMPLSAADAARAAPIRAAGVEPPRATAAPLTPPAATAYMPAAAVAAALPAELTLATLAQAQPSDWSGVVPSPRTRLRSMIFHGYDDLPPASSAIRHMRTVTTQGVNSTPQGRQFLRPCPSAAPTNAALHQGLAPGAAAAPLLRPAPGSLAIGPAGAVGWPPVPAGAIHSQAPPSASSDVQHLNIQGDALILPAPLGQQPQSAQPPRHDDPLHAWQDPLVMSIRQDAADQRADALDTRLRVVEQQVHSFSYFNSPLDQSDVGVPVTLHPFYASLVSDFRAYCALCGIDVTTISDRELRLHLAAARFCNAQRESGGMGLYRLHCP